MPPLFFPYTYLSPSVVDRITTVFDKISIYQPLGSWIPQDLEASFRSGRIEIRVPFGDNEEKLKTILKAYRSWADLHHTPHREFHKIIESLKFSTPDPQSYQIRKEIKERISRVEHRGGLSPSDNARLFLSLAQEYDMQQTGLSTDIKTFQDMQNQLYMNLQGDDNGTDNGVRDISGPSNSDSYEYMVTERLLAWTHLLCRDAKPPCVLITTSQAAFDTVSEQAGLIQPLSGFEKRWMDISDKEQLRQIGRAISDSLDQLTNPAVEASPVHPFETTAHSAGDSGPVVRLTVVVIPNQSPVQLFGNLLHPPLVEPQHMDTDPLCRHTVLTLMDMQT